ncbi:uncharacterized protein KY384_007759 [Bacidia gigantensis]|uniref:uncharacterized protein n=1 Tax=Bacidia gigantensis TaxID=2732470 RepID=UPI001D0493E6|nr:uncharacterized protein KY384_007759 [Bacidia gigantensis]KAG8527606.1 hypothetical protein KY384_007759 [Bacidia gigantensis]
MSLPGLHVPTPIQVEIASSIQDLKERCEWRFEVDYNRSLLSGTAEIFGTELAIQQVYSFTGTKAAIYTWHGCRIEVTGECSVEYIAEETPVTSYANLHFALECLRDEAISSRKEGPRVLIVGPDNAGKTSLVKLLTSYATRSGRQPLVVNLDPKEGLLTIPGTLSATTFTSVLDVEEGWGSSPTNGPTPVPVKLPLVYLPGMENLEDNAAVTKPIISRLALTVMNRLQDDFEARQAGCIIDTAGALGAGKENYDVLQHVVSEFQSELHAPETLVSKLKTVPANIIVVLGSERLYSDLLRRNNGQNTSGGDPTVVIKLDKSGGAVDRDESFRQHWRQAQIREYYFGDAKNTLSPHTLQVDFSQLSIYRLKASANDNNDSFLPGDYEADGFDSTLIFDKVTSPTAQMQNAILAITYAEPNENHDAIRDASVIGFVYVAEVDDIKKKVKLLTPLSGRLPNKAIIWAGWPEGNESLVAPESYNRLRTPPPPPPNPAPPRPPPRGSGSGRGGPRKPNNKTAGGKVTKPEPKPRRGQAPKPTTKKPATGPSKGKGKQPTKKKTKDTQPQDDEETNDEEEEESDEDEDEDVEGEGEGEDGHHDDEHEDDEDDGQGGQGGQGGSSGGDRQPRRSSSWGAGGGRAAGPSPESSLERKNEETRKKNESKAVAASN